MEPRRVAPKKAIEKMKKVYAERRMSTHMPGARHMFPAKVDTWRKPHLHATRIPLVDDRTCSPAQLELRQRNIDHNTQTRSRDAVA